MRTQKNDTIKRVAIYVQVDILCTVLVSKKSVTLSYERLQLPSCHHRPHVHCPLLGTKLAAILS